MAGLGNVSITFDIELIVKVTCLASDCKFNAVNLAAEKLKGPTCGLKHIDVNSHGACDMYTPFEEHEKGKCGASA